MAIFWAKPWFNSFGKISIFRRFERVVFIRLRGVFFVLEYCKTHFPRLYCLKRSHAKMAIFLNKTMGEPLWKNLNFSAFSTCCFYRLERRFFVLEYCKTHFPGLYCKKNRHGKMAIFWAKPWVNPFGKISIFQLFQRVVFIG